jgi:hypothetical protein
MNKIREAKLHVRAPRGANVAKEITVTGHRDPRGPDNNIYVWVDEKDALHIRVLKARRCYQFKGTVSTPDFVEVIAT